MIDEENGKEENPPLEEPRDPISKASKWFEDLKSGYSITVTRLKPTWAQGYLEKLYYVDGEPIDMDYLIRQWGGELLRLQVRNERGGYVSQCDVPLYSFSPRSRGVVLHGPGNEPDKSQAPRGDFSGFASPQAPQHNPLETASGLATLLNQLSQSQQQNLKGYIDFLNRNSQPQTSALGGLEQVVAVAKVYQQLQGIFGSANSPAIPPPLGEGDAAFLPYIADIIKTVLNKEQKPKAPIVGPRIVPVPESKPVQAIESDLENIAKSISGLAPNDAAEVVAAAFGMMPEEKRNLAVPRFMAIVGGGEEGEYEEEEYEEEEYEEEEQGVPEKENK